MQRATLLRVLIVVLLLAMAGIVPATAGGPPCPPPVCGPVMYAPPPMCAPPACPPMKVKPMAACPPPACPPPVCAPAPCGPPPCKPKCGPGPLEGLCRGALNLVTGAIALPFKAVDCLIDKCRRPSLCGAPPPPCPMPPPAPYCGPAPAMAYCGPAGCPPPYGYGMAPPPARPFGFGRGHGPRLVPFSAKKSKKTKMIAGGPASDNLFGTYW